MSRYFKNPNGDDWQSFPYSEEDAKKYNIRRYKDGSTCPQCGTRSSKFVKTHHCHSCQFRKSRALYYMIHADHLWNHDELTCQTEALAEPHQFDIAEYCELIELRDRVLNDRRMEVRQTPCERAGHVGVISGGKCAECSSPSSRQVASSKGQPVYEGKECNVCGTTARHTHTSLCVQCGIKKERQLSERQLAIKKGEDWYMPDTRCKKCGERALKRVNNGQCKGCKPVT